MPVSRHRRKGEGRRRRGPARAPRRAERRYRGTEGAACDLMAACQQEGSGVTWYRMAFGEGCLTVWVREREGAALDAVAADIGGLRARR